MKLEDFNTLLPDGRELELNKLPDGVVRIGYVFPMGFVHMMRVQEMVERLIRSLADSEVLSEEGTSEDKLSRLGLSIMPLLTGDGFKLLNETCVVGLRKPGGAFEPEEDRLGLLPHWQLAAIIEQWWDYNFGTKDKVDPWVRLIERVISQMTGNKSFRLSEAFSRTSSSQVTGETTSSDASSGHPTESGSPTEDGQQDSSGTGQSRPDSLKSVSTSA